MSKCSFLCNRLKAKIDNISGLDDEVVFLLLLSIGTILDSIEAYADEDFFNGTIFNDNNK